MVGKVQVSFAQGGLFQFTEWKIDKYVTKMNYEGI